jgi:hypothetical protein
MVNYTIIIPPLQRRDNYSAVITAGRISKSVKQRTL